MLRSNEANNMKCNDKMDLSIDLLMEFPRLLLLFSLFSVFNVISHYFVYQNFMLFSHSRLKLDRWSNDIEYVYIL